MQNETIKNKSIIIKEDNYTTLSYLELKDKFVRACMRNTREEHAELGLIAQAMANVTYNDPDAAKEHNAACGRSPEFNVIFWLWWKYADLQQSFEKPLHPQQARELLAMMPIAELADIVEGIYNERNSVKGRSLYHTIKHWKQYRDRRNK